MTNEDFSPTKLGSSKRPIPAIYLGTVEEYLRELGLCDMLDVLPQLPTHIRESEAFEKTMKAKVYRARYARNTPAAGRANMGTMQIWLHDKMFTDGEPEHIKATFLHELAHILAELFYRTTRHDRCHHDWRWKKMARAIGDDAGRCHSYPYLTRKTQERKQIYICQSCGNEYPMARKLKHDGRFHHCRCGGAIKRLTKTMSEISQLADLLR